MKEIKAVCWDVDNVIHLQYTTNLLAEHSREDPSQQIQQFIDQGILPVSYLKKWKERNKEIDSVKMAAEMLTDALYSWGKVKKQGSNKERILTPEEAKKVSCKPVLSKEDTIYAKQKILAGITKKRAKIIAEKMKFTPGFREVSKRLYKEGISQVAFSDGADWVVRHLVNNYPFDKDVNYFEFGKGVPPVVRLPDGTVKEQISYEEIPPEAELTGKVRDYNKAEEFFQFIEEEGISLSNVAAIDDSGANVKSLLLPILEKGGIAIGFNPKEKYKNTFRQNDVPFIDQTEPNLKPFLQVVFTPSKLENYRQQ